MFVGFVTNIRYVSLGSRRDQERPWSLSTSRPWRGTWSSSSPTSKTMMSCPSQCTLMLPRSSSSTEVGTLHLLCRAIGRRSKQNRKAELKISIFHVSHLPGFWPVMNLREVQAFGPRGRERDYDGQGWIIYPCWVPRLTSFQTIFE